MQVFISITVPTVEYWWQFLPDLKSQLLNFQELCKVVVSSLKLTTAGGRATETVKNYVTGKQSTDPNSHPRQSLLLNIYQCTNVCIF